MKDLRKNTLDRLSETNQAEEYFSYEPKNAKLSDEQFIFTHDQNNEILAKNYTGEEVNKKFEKLKEHREESLTVEKVQEITTSSGAANAAVASSSVTTAVAATTTAVIAVVGGGMVIQSVTYDPPKVSVAEVVGVTSNTISFNLGLVNDEGSEEGYCDCVIDLKCLSYDETQEIDVGELGTKIYEFEGLRPDTDYSLEIYSKSFLDLERKKLDSYEPITVTTLSGDPTTRSIVIQKQYDPFEDTMFYVEFNDVETSPYYESYTLQAFYPVDYQQSYGAHKHNAYTSDSFADSVLLDEDPTVGQYVNFTNIDPDLKYDFRLIAYNYDPTGVTGQGDGGDGVVTEDDPMVVLAEETIDLSQIETSQFQIVDKTFLKRSGASESEFDIYVGLTSTEGRSEYFLNFYDINYYDDPQAQPLLEQYIEDVNSIQSGIVLDLVDVYTRYYVTLTCTTTNQADFDAFNEQHPDRPLSEGTEEFNNFEIRHEIIDLSTVRRGEAYSRIDYAYISIDSYGFSHDVFVHTQASSYDDWTSYQLTLRDPTSGDEVYTALNEYSEQCFICDGSEYIYEFLNKHRYDYSEMTIDAALLSSGEIVTIYTDDYFYNNINESVEDKLYFQKRTFVGESSDDVAFKYYGFLGINDVDQYSDFKLILYSVNENDEKNEYLTWQTVGEGYSGYNTIFMCDSDVGDYLDTNDKLWIDVTCYSTRQEDIDEWNQTHEGSGVSDGEPVEKVIRSEIIVTSEIPEVEEEAPAVSYVDLEIRHSNYNSFVYVTIRANTFDYWSDLNLTLADSEEYQTSVYAYLEFIQGDETERVYRCEGDDGVAAFLEDFGENPFLLSIDAMDLLYGNENVTIYKDEQYVWKGSIIDGGIDGAILFETDSEGGVGYKYVEIAGATALLEKYYYFQIVFVRQSDYEEFTEEYIDIEATNVHINCMDGQSDMFEVRLEGMPYYGDGEFHTIFRETINFSNI